MEPEPVVANLREATVADAVRVIAPVAVTAKLSVSFALPESARELLALAG
jgi:hypothetical protein